jgi:hypothetical protein
MSFDPQGTNVAAWSIGATGTAAAVKMGVPGAVLLAVESIKTEARFLWTKGGLYVLSISIYF